jgi:hypothetical protein
MLELHFSSFSTLKMGQTVGPETSLSNHNKTPGNYPKDDKLYTSNHSESLKFNMSTMLRRMQIF